MTGIRALGAFRIFLPPSLQITLLLLCVNMPDYVIWQPYNLIASPVGHCSEAFRIGLVFESITREVDAYNPTSLVKYTPLSVYKLITGEANLICEPLL